VSEPPAARVPAPSARPAAPDPAAAPPSGAGLVNAANAVTGLRMLLIPVFAGLLLARHGGDPALRTVAAAVFVVASLTDRVDGELARRRRLITAFGQVADPIADKALVGAALLSLSALGELSWWVTGVVLAREVGVTGLRLWVIRHGVIPASRGGKVKTVLQSLAIGLYVLPLSGAPAAARGWVMAAAVVLTLVTGTDYILRALRVRAAARRGDRTVR